MSYVNLVHVCVHQVSIKSLYFEDLGGYRDLKEIARDLGKRTAVYILLYCIYMWGYLPHNYVYHDQMTHSQLESSVSREGTQICML